MQHHHHHYIHYIDDEHINVEYQHVHHDIIDDLHHHHSDDGSILIHNINSPFHHFDNRSDHDHSADFIHDSTYRAYCDFGPADHTH